MPLPAGSLSAFFTFHHTIGPRHIASHCELTAKRIGQLRHSTVKPTAHDIAQLAIAFGVPYDDVLNEFLALEQRSIEFLRQQMAGADHASASA